MFHRFEIEKAVQAAGVLLRLHRGRQMSCLRLQNLLYLADRQNLKTVARPILGNVIVARPEGPQHQDIWEILGGGQLEPVTWSHCIQRDGYVVELVEEAGVLDLSAQEIETLGDIARANTARNDWVLVEDARAFPEWKKNFDVKSTGAIPLSDILEAVGWSDEDRAAILE